MNQKHDRFRELEEENKILKEQLSRMEAGKLQSEYMDKIITYNKEVVVTIAYDGNGTIEKISNSISAYGYTSEEFISGKLSFWDIIYSEDIENLKKSIDKKTSSSSVGFEVDFRICDKAGQIIWMKGAAIPLTGPSGHVERHFVKMNNINKRKKYEEELLDTNEDLFVTLKSIGESVILLDADGYIERLNAAAEKMIGILSLKAKNKRLQDVVQFSFSPDFSVLVDPTTMNAETRKMVQLDEIFMRCPFGVQYRVSCNVSPIVIQKSKLKGYVMVVKDLTAIYDTLHSAQENELALKAKLELLLSGSDTEVSDVKLTDIIPIEQLQSLQDKFSLANGVSSVISDLDNEPITEPSNFNDVCTSVFYAGEKCFQVSRLIKNVHPTDRPCKLIDAKAPIYIGGKHVADWKIGMCGFGGVIAPFVKSACNSNEEYTATYTRSQPDVRKHFEDVQDLLTIMANKISEIGYNNIKLAHDLIKGKEDEARIAESETTLRSIFDNSVDGLILTDPEGIIKEWSRGYEQLSGISKKQALGRHIWDVVKMMLPENRFNEDEIEKMHAELDKIILLKEYTVVTRQIVNKRTKQERIVHALYFPVHAPGGTMVGAISRDVTEDIRNEKRLIENNALLEGIMNTIPTPLFVKNMNGGYIKFNNAFLDVFGFNREQVLGKTVSDIFPKQSKEVNLLEEKLHTDNNLVQTVTGLHTVSGERDGVIYRNVFYDEAGKKQGLVGVIFDTTDLKDAERELIAEKERLQSLGDNFPNGCLFRFVYDIRTNQMTIAYLSKTWDTLTGIPRTEAMKDINMAFSMIVPEDLPVYMQAVTESVANLSRFNIEVRCVVDKSDDIRWFQISSQPRQEGYNILCDGYILDISNRKQAERKLIAEKDRLQALGDNFPDGCLFQFEIDIATQKMEFSYLGGTWTRLTNTLPEDALLDLNVPFGKVYTEDLPILMQAIQESAATLNNCEAEIRYHYTEKETRWFQVLSHPHVEGGTIVSDGFILDISNRKRAEKEVVAEQNRLQALGDNFPDGCLFRSTMDIRTQEMQIVYMSQSWEVLSGIAVEDVLNDINVSLDRVYPEDLPKYIQAIKDSAQTMTNMNVEVRFWFDNNTIRWVHVSSHPHMEGELVVWDGFILDITDRKNAEQELEQYRMDLEGIVKDRTEELEASNEELYATNEELYATNEEFAVINEELHHKNDLLQQEITARKQVMQQLEDSENKMRNFIQQSFEGIVILNDEGKVIEWNTAQEKITEIPREKAIGQYAWDIYQQIVTGDQTEKQSKQFHEYIMAFTQPGQKQVSDESEHTFHTSGGERFIQMTTFPIGLADRCYVGQIVRDITEQKMIDLELEHYRTQLEEMVAIQTKELVVSKERLTSLSDNLPGGVIYQMHETDDNKTRFTYISAQFTDMFHVDVNDVMADSSKFFDLIYPDDRKVFNDFSTIHESDSIDIECRITLETSAIKWIHMRSSFRREEDIRVWDGFMVDITDKKIAEQELEETRKRQNILIKVLQVVQSSENIPDALNIALAEIGHYAGISRAYIFEKSADGRTANNSYEWCNEGVIPEIDNLQNVPIEYMQDWFEAFEAGSYICTSDIKTLSPTAYEQLSAQGIKSILVLPLVANGINYGFVGFDECVHYKEWQQKEIDLIISLSQIISSTTRRHWAEKSMQLSQQTMRTVLDNINANIYVADFDTWEILFANKKVKDELGDEIEGKKCWQVIQKNKNAPCDYCPNPKLLDKNKRPTGLYHWEAWNENMQRWYECTDAAIEWVDGHLVHMEYATDVTNRKKAEEALRQSEEMYRQLTVASPDAIIVCSPMGHIMYMSPKAKGLFLIDDHKNVESLRLYRYVHQHDMQRAFEMFRLFVQDSVAFLPQLLLKRSDGSEFFGEISSASVKDAEGQTTSVIMIIRDITERKMSEMELIRAKEKAEESDKLKSAFLANMSHEIRTPINGIIGFLNFLADDNLTPKRRQEYINVVNNSSVQLVKLIDDIIDVAKIEAKQMSIRPVPFRINEFMNDLQVFFETFLQANNKDKIALILDDSQFIDQCVTFVDPMRLRQVLTNLIGNAIKFTEKGYIRFAYSLLESDKLEFVVEDSGIGLAQDQLEVIFERFRQAELTNSRRFGGTGLGLTISRSLVQMMGGDVHVESVEGVGSTFSFTVSYLPIDAADEQLFEESKPDTTDNKPFKGKTILIVEPEPMTGKYYEKLLSATGATLMCAQTTKQWIDTISQHKRIDVVLANATIFEADDMETIRQIKSIRSGLPLVLIIPERNDIYKRVISDSQCNRTVDGPVNYAKLYDALKKYTER